MPRIQATFEAIRDDLIADPTAQFTGAEGEPTSLTTETILIGGEFVSQNAAYPRVVFVPMTGPIVQSDRSQDNPNHLHTWELSYDVYCWGADFDGAFDLMQAVVRTVRRKAVGAYVLARADFLASNTETLIYGRALKFPLTIRHPITDAPIETIELDETTVTPQFITF